MKEYSQKNKKRKYSPLFIIFMAFILVLGFLFYTSFYNPSLGEKITGNVVRDKDITQENSVEIKAKLGVPEKFSIDSKISKLSLAINKPSDIFIGNQKVELDKKSSVIIDSFDGKLEITSVNVVNIDGMASRIFIDGIPIAQSSGSDMKVKFENLEYNYLEINDFFLDSLSYQTSGKININQEKIIINLNNENFELKDFKGDLKISGGSLSLSGFLDKSNLKNLIETSSNES